MTFDDKTFRTTIAARHTRLFELLESGQISANRLHEEAALPDIDRSGAEFLRDAAASISPDRKPHWWR
ncbi:hypothetical protein ATO6_17295 [Oceanicola sp. 22II-s10i]|uniref:hypothetical protein n=1 Tax=Oceanicola sp. 22II-s10i TaxID=1317116 RepID=UPI000B522587|nr:hypothetical protein [Oceanicola sp. 22II-s10i]OWU83618.1 hypothetical protein ATO6_17295 [Oceanicola sp. 22II-s10i]